MEPGHGDVAPVVIGERTVGEVCCSRNVAGAALTTGEDTKRDRPTDLAVRADADTIGEKLTDAAVTTGGGSDKETGGRDNAEMVVMQLPPVTLSVCVPAAYSSACGPLIALAAPWLQAAQLTAAARHLEGLWAELEPWTPVLLTWLEWLRLELLDFLELGDGLVLGSGTGESFVCSVGPVRAGCELVRPPHFCVLLDAWTAV